MRATNRSPTFTQGSITPGRGNELYDFVRKARPQACLELGFAHGISSLYIAAALEANGEGQLVSVDNRTALELVPVATDLAQEAGLSHRVDFVFEETSYNWFLQRILRQQKQDSGITPLYDFVFIDGAHTWIDDGLSFLLADRLLKPGGTVLFDDLAWRMDERWTDVPDAERALAQVGEVFDLLVATHPGYDRLTDDSDWGWAHKSQGTTPTVRTVYRRDLVGSAGQVARIIARRLRRSPR